MEVLCECKAIGDLRQLPQAWHGWWCDASHHIVFRRKRPHSVWHLPLYHYKDSAVLALEVRLELVPPTRSQPDRFVSFVVGQRSVVMAVLDHTLYEVLGFTWRSWAWQAQRLGKTRVACLRLGIRAFADEGSSASIMEAVAKAAFWQLPKSSLGVLVGRRPQEHVGVVEALARHTLGLAGEKCLAILEQRLVAPIRSADAGAGILEVSRMLEGGLEGYHEGAEEVCGEVGRDLWLQAGLQGQGFLGPRVGPPLKSQGGGLQRPRQAASADGAFPPGSREVAFATALLSVARPAVEQLERQVFAVADSVGPRHCPWRRMAFVSACPPSCVAVLFGCQRPRC